MRLGYAGGPWYYGACVDSVSGETETGNNCSSGVRVTVYTLVAPQIYNDNLIVLPIGELPIDGAFLNVRAYARSIYQWLDDTFDYPMFFFNNILRRRDSVDR